MIEGKCQVCNGTMMEYESLVAHRCHRCNIEQHSRNTICNACICNCQGALEEGHKECAFFIAKRTEPKEVGICLTCKWRVEGKDGDPPCDVKPDDKRDGCLNWDLNEKYTSEPEEEKSMIELRLETINEGTD